MSILHSCLHPALQVCACTLFRKNCTWRGGCRLNWKFDFSEAYRDWRHIEDLGLLQQMKAQSLKFKVMSNILPSENLFYGEKQKIKILFETLNVNYAYLSCIWKQYKGTLSDIHLLALLMRNTMSVLFYLFMQYFMFVYFEPFNNR